MLSGGLPEWDDRIVTVSQSAFARDNHWRTASRVASFINDLSVLVGKIDDMVDYTAPSLIFLRRLQVDVQRHGEISQKAADSPEPVSLRQIGLGHDQDIHVALLGCIAAPIAPEEDDLIGIEVVGNTMENTGEFCGGDHGRLSDAGSRGDSHRSLP